MLPIIDINKTAINLMPPNKRTPNYKARQWGLISGLKQLYDKFKVYVLGAEAFYPIWDNASAYPLGSIVIDRFQTYIAITSTTGTEPNTDPTNWAIYDPLPSFIGTNERMLYTPSKIVLEYALNHYFKQQLTYYGYDGFLQPPLTSSIYIQNVENIYTTFKVGKTVGDKVATTFSGAFVTETEIFGTATTYQFNINIPLDVYNYLGTSDIADTIIRNFADNYVISGVRYNIRTY